MGNSHKPTSSMIFKKIRDRIINLEYPPGMSLSDKDLSKEFKVSRTPIREALKKLEDMNLVTSMPRYGTYVTRIDVDEIRCAFQVKIRLEMLAGEIAAQRITSDKLEEMNNLLKKASNDLNKSGPGNLIEIDAQFHEIIRSSAQNYILEDFIDNLHGRCARLWTSSLDQEISAPEVIDQLRKIYSALKAKDSQKVGTLIENHIQYFIERIKNTLL